jgi:CheY-like chemotaxis protein
VAVKILAADDSSTMRKVLEMTFAGEAVEIETVGDGEAAVERASQLSPDLVIADVSMSMDGYEVARALKSKPVTQNVAVILLASQHHPYDPERGRAAGVDDHILKPYDTQALIDKARDVLSRPRARASGVAAAPSPATTTTATTATGAARPPLPLQGQAPGPRAPSLGRPGATGGAPPSTVAFGAMPRPKPPPAARPLLELADEEPAPPPARTPSPAAVAAPPASRPLGWPLPPPSAQATPAAPPAAAAAAATSEGGPMAARLVDMGLSSEQVEGVLALSREVIERVVWEVVPDLAEIIIREEIRRLTSE